MRKFNVLFVVMLFVGMMAGCSSVPLKQDTALAPYRNVVVEDLDFTQIKNLDYTDKDELSEIAKDSKELSQMFRERFAEATKRMGYFDRVTDGGSVSESAVVVKPSIVVLNCGMRVLVPSRIEIAAKIMDASSGKELGTITQVTSSGRPAWASVIGTVQNDIADLGEKIAKRLPAMK